MEASAIFSLKLWISKILSTLSHILASFCMFDLQKRKKNVEPWKKGNY